MAIFRYKWVDKAKMWKIAQFLGQLQKKLKSWQIWLVWSPNY